VLLAYIAHRSWVSRRQGNQTEVAPGLVEQE
jgi:hypothetical protein